MEFKDFMNKIEFKKIAAERILIMDGALGTELQRRGYLGGSTAPEELNIVKPENIREIHKNYLDAGSDVILANTFGANRLKLKDYGLTDKLESINRAGIDLAKESARKYSAFAAADIGPLGAYLTPLGAISFDEAYEVFSQQVRALSKSEPDLIIIETMAEIREVKAALLAVKDNFTGPVIVQMTFTQDGTTVTGTDVLAFLSVVEGMGADGIGMNCSVGPKDLANLVKRLCKHTDLPVSFKPNAGMPKLINRETVFPGTIEEFVQAAEQACRAGVNLVGGCCGTNPDYIRALSKTLKNQKPVSRNVKDKFLISSRTKAVNLSQYKKLVCIGERINPTNRKKFQQELLAGNFSVLRREAQEQANAGADILDLNLGLPGADEKLLMSRAVEEIQDVVSVPLCLDSSSCEVLEAGIKACAGKPIVNSVNGDDKVLNAVLPLVKRYGTAVIGLATDENGIPKTYDERLKIAGKIIRRAKEFAISESEIILDFLTLAISAMPGQVKETLTAIKESKKRWPRTKTVLGISNVSFGLPDRQALNSTFLKLALESGLDMAILNPMEKWDIYNKSAEDFLLGKDLDGAKYILAHNSAPKTAHIAEKEKQTPETKLYSAVIEGNKDEIGKFVREVLTEGKSPLAVANDILLKSLNEVGAKFKKKEYFLPQVIRSAETAQTAFAVIKPLLKAETGFKQGKIVLATVKGDVHDIGKNIVGAVLESHGWEVIDLGKNVEADKIIETAKRENCQLIGISALMTTTMLEMEKVVQSRNNSGTKLKIMVGGAPVTENFAKQIGADGYAKDAVEAARIAQELIKS